MLVLVISINIYVNFNILVTFVTLITYVALILCGEINRCHISININDILCWAQVGTI
jgi:hypothetical protein